MWTDSSTLAAARIQFGVIHQVIAVRQSRDFLGFESEPCLCGLPIVVLSWRRSLWIQIRATYLSLPILDFRLMNTTNFVTLIFINA